MLSCPGAPEPVYPSPHKEAARSRLDGDDRFEFPHALTRRTPVLRIPAASGRTHSVTHALLKPYSARCGFRRSLPARCARPHLERWNHSATTPGSWALMRSSDAMPQRRRYEADRRARCIWCSRAALSPLPALPGALAALCSLSCLEVALALLSVACANYARRLSSFSF